MKHHDSVEQWWSYWPYAVLAISVATAAVAVPRFSTESAIAQATLQEARALRGWVASQVEALPREQGPTYAPAEVTPEGAAIEAGLRDVLMRVETVTDGAVSLSFKAVAFDALTPWLAEMQATGFVVAAMDLQRVRAGVTDAAITLRRE